MKNYTYLNELIGKKQLRSLLAWSFTKYDCMQACSLADELKSLGFKYATIAGISISIEDLKIPFMKNLLIKKANYDLLTIDKLYFIGKFTDIEKLQKTINTWSLTSESLKKQIIYYFKNYDPLNSVYIMAFSGARGNLAQVRQLVGMRGLMADPSGQILNLPIKKNFREGLTITDYLISGYGARKGIVDTALKTANSGYLTRRLIDVSQDILIREKDCFTNHSLLISTINNKLIGRILNKSISDLSAKKTIVASGTQITPLLINKLQEKKIENCYIRSPLTCTLYRAICQQCYGWDLANENLVDMGEAIGILAGQSIGEPGTQLTMRTFHTGGVFNATMRNQILSPINGIIRLYKFLRTSNLRTNSGEDVVLVETSGSLILIPDYNYQKLVRLEVSRNTILFPKNNQYVLKDTVIGEILNTNIEIKKEIKPILSENGGEIIIPKLRTKNNFIYKNQLIWILFGQFYNNPNNSFLTFSRDYKINMYDSVSRTKIISNQSAFSLFNNHNDLSNPKIQLISNYFSLFKSTIKKLKVNTNSKFYVLNINKLVYLVRASKKTFNVYLHVSKNSRTGILILNEFRTLTGGHIYYNYFVLGSQIKKYKKFTAYLPFHQPSFLKSNNSFFVKTNSFFPFKSFHKTIFWLNEEIYKIKCNEKKIFVENGDFISKNFELISNIFSKVSGIISIENCSNSNQIVSIKPGKVYQGKKLKKVDSIICYPGEINLSSISVSSFYLVQQICKNNLDYLLLRIFEIYEFPYFNFLEKSNTIAKLTFNEKAVYSYKSNQKILSINSLNLVLNLLLIKNCNLSTNRIVIQLKNNNKKNLLSFLKIQKISLEDCLIPHLKYGNVKSCFLLQQNQFINSYASLGYLESITEISLEIVKIKLKGQKSKQILVISNKDCLIVNKNEIINKEIDDFILNSNNINEIGKVIGENNNFFIIQKGKLYFFPNCKNEYEEFNDNLIRSNLQYNGLLNYSFKSTFNKKRSLSLNSYNFFKLSLKNNYDNLNKFLQFLNLNHDFGLRKIELSTFFLKKNGKLYSCLVPQFIKKFTITNKRTSSNFKTLLSPFRRLLFAHDYSQNKMEILSKQANALFNPISIKKPIEEYLNIIPDSDKKQKMERKLVKLLTKYKVTVPISKLLNISEKIKINRKKKQDEQKIQKRVQETKEQKINCEISETKKEPRLKTKNVLKPIHQNLLIQSSELIKNTIKSDSVNKFNSQLTLIKFAEHSLTELTKSIGLYSITEDYFEQEGNNIFCKNFEFIENGTMIGLLSLEKEITGDIVQGLPKIEEILEARKKNVSIKRIPTSQKKKLLIQKASLDPIFEFKKLGLPLKETDKINPHKLLKVYFNYYGLVKLFSCEINNQIYYARLINNYEGSYKSFKKVQILILKAVQSVYQSQGVNINDKHLEVIIKQMTTKIRITDEGNTPLLRQEVLDLYHIQHINKVVSNEENKKIANYVPLLLGITKAALNNPSFISAASFQETIRVLTKAAIEGRIDWLRGLKENIITGQLITAGTGYRNYRLCFDRFSNLNTNYSDDIINFLKPE